MNFFNFVAFINYSLKKNQVRIVQLLIQFLWLLVTKTYTKFVTLRSLLKMLKKVFKNVKKN